MAVFDEKSLIASSLSVEGRTIQCISLGPPPVDKLDTLILAVTHGDEPESGILAEAFLSMAMHKPSRVSLPLGLIPVLNPDGLNRSTRMNANGVDINRNFQTRDWICHGEGTAYYNGPTALSEPETRFLADIVTQYKPRQIISLHTPYRIINYDGPALPLAECMAAKNGYGIEASIGYPTPGSFGTYAGVERNIPVITLELPEGDAFTPQEINANLEALWAAVLFDLPVSA